MTGEFEIMTGSLDLFYCLPPSPGVPVPKKLGARPRGARWPRRIGFWGTCNWGSSGLRGPRLLTDIGLGGCGTVAGVRSLVTLFVLDSGSGEVSSESLDCRRDYVVPSWTNSSLRGSWGVGELPTSL